MDRMARIVGLLAALAMVGATATAAAQGGLGEAEAHFTDGERFYAAGDFDSAIAAFRRAYDLLEGNPDRYLVLFNIGRCQESLFRYDEALASYQGFVAAAPRGHERYADAAQRIRALDASLGSLQIATNASQAEIWLDNRRIGTAPGTVRVPSGRHLVELRAHGFAPSRQDVTVAARTAQQLTFTLDRTFGGVSPAFFIAGAALTVGAAGVGIGFGAVAMGERSTIDGRLASADPAERYQVTQAQIDAMEQSALVADVLFGVAGGLAIASVILLFVTDWGGASGAAQNDAPTILPFASQTELGLAIRGTL